MESNTQKIDTILNFWFGDLRDNEVPSEQRSRIWWIKDHENDKRIKDLFEDDLLFAMAGELEDWRLTPSGSMALILLLDQFSRNIYRNDPRAFIADSRALKICLESIENAFDKELHPIQRVFFYMPLMHSEDLDMQEKSIECFSNLKELFMTPQSIAKTVSGSFEYAMKHYEIIKRFGRYPHRNTILGRESTPDEVKFLTEPGSSF